MLTAAHAARLRASAISDEVAAERGYQSITRAEAAEFGFKGQQQRAGLLVPIRDVHGEIALHQLRPDKPRVRKGKATKYETAAGARMVLDVPLRSRQCLDDPKIPLWITEGAKKVDSLLSAGAEAVIGLAGVWSWRGTNDAGGKTALAAFDSIAVNGRTVYLAFDSDCATNAHVQHALARLAGFLISRAARVRFVVLPPQADGSKRGVDDYLAAGHSLDDAIALARDELPREPGAKFVGPYMISERGIFRLGHDSVGNPTETCVANFTAEIVADIVEDDGSGDGVRVFELEVQRQGREPVRIRVPAGAFERMAWVPEQLGARASLAPDRGAKEHLRAAIQAASDQAVERLVYTHSGWRHIGDQSAYLHTGGALGADGPIDDVEVRLPSALRHLQLPDPPTGGALAAAVRRALLVLDLAPYRLSVPLFAMPFAAVLGVRAFSVFAVGPTGVLKTSATCVAQQFFGAGFDAQNLPGNWNSTPTYLEQLLHAAKDALVLVDDFQLGHGFDRQKMDSAADRVLRGAVSGSSRGRCRQDGSAQSERPPRALTVVTAEDVPRRQSLLARMVVLEVQPGDVRLDVLTELQAYGAKGELAAAMSGFIRWCAEDLAGVRQRLRQRQVELRDEATTVGQHLRTPDAAGWLGAVLEVVLGFAVEVGAIAETERADLWADGWAAILGDAGEQAEHQDAENPATKFLALLGSALATGRAHLLSVDGSVPGADDAGRMGWRLQPGWRPHDPATWQPGGAAIGWADGDEMFIDSAAAMAVATRLARDGGDDLAIGRRTLLKRLSEAHYLASTETEGTRTRFEIRKVIGGMRRRVLHLRPADVLGVGHPVQVDHAVGHEEPANRNGHSANGPLGPLTVPVQLRTTGGVP